VLAEMKKGSAAIRRIPVLGSGKIDCIMYVSDKDLAVRIDRGLVRHFAPGGNRHEAQAVLIGLLREVGHYKPHE
jgi:hypothetical protein